MKKHILVTGAAGFIGFHLAKALKARGDEVIGFDNFNDYYDPTLKHNRAAELKKHGVKVIKGDISNKKKLLALMEKHGITHIAHLAAQAGVRYSLVNPDVYVEANLAGFVNILEICRHTSAKLTYASSSSIYGANTKIPFAESDITDNPVSLYGATKKANELLAYSYHHLFGISMSGLRFFTVYGPWGRPDMAYYSFAKAILEGKTIDLFNHGKMERDFTYIDDIIAGTIAAIDLEAPFEIFNLGNNHPEKLGTLVELLEKNLGKKAITRQLPMQPGDVVTTYADIKHSQELLGYTPKTPLVEGIRKFCDWYRQ